MLDDKDKRFVKDNFKFLTHWVRKEGVFEEIIKNMRLKSSYESDTIEKSSHTKSNDPYFIDYFIDYLIFYGCQLESQDDT